MKVEMTAGEGRFVDKKGGSWGEEVLCSGTPACAGM